MEDFIRRLEKAELHVHLEGSIEPETLCEMDSSLSVEEVRRRYSFVDFAGFIEAFKWVVGYLREPDHYALAARRLFERMEREGVRYAEVTLSAGVVLMRGQAFQPIYEAVTRQAARSGVEVWWVLDAVRQFGAEKAMEIAKLAVERAGDRVVAFGIGGDEAEGPVEWFAEVFAFCKEHGLKLVPHAGETVGPESVWAAVRLGADRLGHGIRAIDDPALVEVLRERRIPLEVCIGSNVATGAVRSLEEHPVRRLWEAGVGVILNTDDPAMFGTSLVNEYGLAARLGFSREELATLAAQSLGWGFRS